MFDLSHCNRTTFNMGHLVPTFCKEVLPGDKFTISVENLLRFAPLIAPVMHDVHVTTHVYFVPFRLIWPEFTDWITGESEVADPTITINNLAVDSLGGYLELPTGDLGTDDLTVGAGPIAAYNLIYNEYYRDQNLIDPLPAELSAGDNTSVFGSYASGDTQLRAWSHDYYTSALPFAQKGDDVMLPLADFTDVPVDLQVQPSPNAGMRVVDANLGNLNNDTIGTGGTSGLIAQTAAELAFLDPNDNLVAKTSEMESISTSVTNVRNAFKLQMYLEKLARGGTRYKEYLRTMFNVRSPDARLDRPEYLGSALQKMTISEVLSTAQTLNNNNVTTNPVGQMAGHGISHGMGREIKYNSYEHGFIMGIINVQPVTCYQQGLPKMYSRRDPLDYYLRDFAHIGEQAILNKELYANATNAVRDQVFGYAPRYSEYKYAEDRVSGNFKTDLNFWHLGRIFASQPTLNAEFIQCDPTDIDRIFAVTADKSNHIWGIIRNNITAVRSMARYGNPGF